MTVLPVYLCYVLLYVNTVNDFICEPCHFLILFRLLFLFCTLMYIIPQQTAKSQFKIPRQTAAVLLGVKEIGMKASDVAGDIYNNEMKSLNFVELGGSTS